MGLTNDPTLYSVDPETGVNRMHTTSTAKFQGLSTAGEVVLLPLTTAWVEITYSIDVVNTILIENQSDNDNIILFNYVDKGAGVAEGMRIFDGGIKTVTLKKAISVWLRMKEGTGLAALDAVG